MNSPLYLSQKLLEVLPPIVHRLRAQARIAVKGKISLPQFRILANIRRGIKTVGEIATLEDVAQPTMSKMVDGLVRKGLVKRIAVAHDRRQIHLELTKKGSLLFTHSVKLVQTHASRDLAKLSPSDRALLLKTLEQLDMLIKKQNLPHLPSVFESKKKRAAA